LETTRAWNRKLQSEAEAAAALVALVHRVELSRDGLRLSLKVPMSLEQDRDPQPPSDAAITRFIPMRLQRRGAELRLVIQGAHPARPKVDLTLLRAVGRARGWFQQLALGEATSLGEIAAHERIGVRYIARLIPLAFLAPPIVESIAEGRHPSQLSTERLTKGTVLPREWEAQQRSLVLSGNLPRVEVEQVRR